MMSGRLGFPAVDGRDGRRAFKGTQTSPCFTSKLERPGAVATATEDREIPHYILPLVVSFSSLRPVLWGGRRALHADAGWLVTALVVSIPKLVS